MTDERIHDEVKRYYRRAVRERAIESDDERWGASRYDADSLAAAPAEAAALSMGCGNPHQLADLQPGETVLDLGSGGGLDVILSARRVAPGGLAYGVDFLDEMLEVARANASEAGVANVEFLAGTIERVPLPDSSVDVVISNCVICLAPDKASVFHEVARVLRPGGRLAVADVVADGGARTPADHEQWSDCGAGALRRDEYVKMLGAAGLTEVSVEYTHDTGPGLHGAIVRATRR